MPILHIEHAITDFAVWSRAFDTLADRRRSAGVRSERVCRPSDDPHYVLIDLDFATREQATAFLSFLQQTVWASRNNSPALAGRPDGRVLDVEYETSAVAQS